MAVPLTVYNDSLKGIEISHCVSSTYASSFDTTIGVALARRKTLAFDDTDAPPRPKDEVAEDEVVTNVVGKDDGRLALLLVLDGVELINDDVLAEVPESELEIEVMGADVLLIEDSSELVIIVLASVLFNDEIDSTEFEVIIGLIVIDGTPPLNTDVLIEAVRDELGIENVGDDVLLVDRTDST